MKYRISILRDARADEDEIARYLAMDSLDAAMRFFDAVYDTYRMIQAHPLRWPKFDADDSEIADIRKKGRPSILKLSGVISNRRRSGPGHCCHSWRA